MMPFEMKTVVSITDICPTREEYANLVRKLDKRRRDDQAAILVLGLSFGLLIGKLYCVVEDMLERMNQTEKNCKEEGTAG